MRRLAEAQQLPELHVESFHDAIAGDGLVQDVLNVGELVLAAAGSAAHIAADAEDRAHSNEPEDREDPGQAPAERDHDNHHEGEREGLLQEVGEDRRGHVLHALDVVDEGGEQRAGGVLLEEGDGAAQDRLVEVVAHVGDHAEAGVVGEISAGVVANALEQRGGDEREGDHGPVVVEARRDQVLEGDVDVPARTDFAEQRALFGAADRGAGVQNVVEDGADEQDAEGVEQADAGGEDDGGESLEPVTARVVQQAPDTHHAARAPGQGNKGICLFYRAI